MKVLFFSHQSEFLYGGEICTLAFLRELKNIGVEVHFAAPRGPYLEEAKKFAKTHVVSSSQFSRELLQLWRLPQIFWQTHQEIAEVVEREKIDLIHVTSLKAMAYFLFFPKRLPLIWHHHDILPKRFDNDLWLKALARRADHIFVPSNASRSVLQELGIAHVSTLYNGFRAEDWLRKLPRKESEPFRVGMVGEISLRKGADRWESIVEKLAKKYTNLEFVVIGDGLSDPEFAKSIQDSLAKYPVKFLGRCSDMKEQYSRLDTILVLSRQDPLPTVIIEAGFSGVPAIGTKVGGIPELIEDERSGFLIETNEEVVTRVEKLMDEKNWINMSALTLQKMKTQFSIEASVKRLHLRYEVLTQ
jgi:glycosyltransferase involved in cell wall biosynthesis